MRVIRQVMIELATVFIGVIVGLSALILLVAYGVLLAATALLTFAMTVFALFCTVAWLFTHAPRTGFTALGYWGYAAAGFAVMIALMAAKLWIVAIPERRQARLAQQRMERIGRLRLAREASFEPSAIKRALGMDESGNGGRPCGGPARLRDRPVIRHPQPRP